MADRITRPQDTDGSLKRRLAASPPASTPPEEMEPAAPPSPNPDMTRLVPLPASVLDRMHRADPTIARRYRQRGGE